jgi:cytochrome P450/NADPH-cytochrome P450 reductase
MSSNYKQNWWKAHRILMPVFGPLPVRKMFPEMLDMISQMVLKWDRYGPDNEIVTSDDFTISATSRLYT